MSPRIALSASVAALVALVTALAAGACGSQSLACEAPATTTYDCTPIDPDAGVPGCAAGPNPLSANKPDPDKLFPNGCLATIPACSAIKANQPEQCRCEPNRLLDGGLSWICPAE